MSVEASVTSIKASIKTLNSFLSGIDGWYEEYSGDHTSTDCKNVKGRGLEGDVKKAKEDVRSLIKTYEKYLDDTKWIATLREYKSTWNKAARDCAEADLEVLSKKLRATGARWCRCTPSETAPARRAPRRGCAASRSRYPGRSCRGRSTTPSYRTGMPRQRPAPTTPAARRAAAWPRRRYSARSIAPRV